MPKIYQNLKSHQCFITIPKAIMQAKQWKGGMEIEMVLDNVGNLILRPKQS